MDKKSLQWALITLIYLSVMSQTVSAATATNIVCTVINQVMEAFAYVAPTIIFIMFLYGGIKYAFSSDDPGGRKQGKMICIHAVVGGIIVLLVEWLATILTNAGLAVCTGLTTTM